MKVVISIDSFKGSISSYQAGLAVERALKSVYPDAEVVKVSVADGGEGTVDALCENKVSVNVCGPLKKQVCAEYGITDDGVAVIEMAAAAGITLVNEEDRNPMKTTTFGVGELILDAIDKGCRDFIIGIGGSATNDGGIGMLTALGYEFYDENNMQIDLGAYGIQKLKKISNLNVNNKLSECRFTIACDVTNPLCGENGCSRIFAPQKGANEKEIALMDSWLENYAFLTKEIFPQSDKDYPGCGASGGLGFAFMSYLGASLKSGIDTVIEYTGIESEIKDADFVITGEGRLDYQSVMGKVPVGIAKLAKKYNVPVIAFCGCEGKDAEACNSNGINAYFPILRDVTTLNEALSIENASENLEKTAKQVFLLIKSIKKV